MAERKSSTVMGRPGRAVSIIGAMAAAALALAAAPWLYSRIFDTVAEESLVGCWTEAPTQPAAAALEGTQLCLRMEAGQLRFAYDQLRTIVHPDERFLTVCQWTGTAHLEELRNWRGVTLRRVALERGAEQPLCQDVFASGDGIVDWRETRGGIEVLPYCSYHAEIDAVVCSFADGPLARRQAGASRADGEHCAVVRTALSAGVLPDERVALWRRLDEDHCAGAAREVVAQAAAAPLPRDEMLASGCHALTFDGGGSWVFCFGEPSHATYTRRHADYTYSCTSPIAPQRSSPPWQFEFSLVLHCQFSNHPERRHASRSPYGTTRYCSVAAGGRLTCVSAPGERGWAYTVSSGH